MISWMFSILGEVPIKCNIFSEEFHISVTRTLILKFHWIDSFVEEVKKLCEQTNSFNLELLNVRAYTNEETTRTFLGIECFESKGILAHFIKSLNNVLAEYELPPFYEVRVYIYVYIRNITFLFQYLIQTAFYKFFLGFILSY